MPLASTSHGRLPKKEQAQSQRFDAPQKMVRAMLGKQDEIIDKLNSILVAIEAATDGNSLFTALDTAAIKAVLAKLKLTD